MVNSCPVFDLKKKMLYVSFLFADITIKEVFLIGSMEGAWCTNLGSTLTAGNKQTVVCNSVVCNTSVFISYRLKIHFFWRGVDPQTRQKLWKHDNRISSRHVMKNKCRVSGFRPKSLATSVWCPRFKQPVSRAYTVT